MNHVVSKRHKPYSLSSFGKHYQVIFKLARASCTHGLLICMEMGGILVKLNSEFKKYL